MKDSVIAQLRTVVPAVMGSILVWAASNGIEIDPETQTALTVAALGVATAVWRFVFGQIEKRFPSAGWFLGYPKAPTYPDSGPVSRDAEDAATEAYRQINANDS